MNNDLIFIFGPCAMESEAMVMEVAQTIASLQKQKGIEIVFKASFDKANRTRWNAYRGLGFQKSLEILQKVKSTYGLKILTDIHETHQAQKVGEIADIVQIPAFLSRQTDLIRAAAATGKIVQVKKGPFLSPYDMKYVREKLVTFGAKEIWFCERGTTWGYGDLVVDMRGLAMMKEILKEVNGKVIFDAGHSTQKPNGRDGQSGGDRSFIPILGRAAVAVGVDGLYCEVHPNPSEALSDAETQWPLAELGRLLDEWLFWGRCQSASPK